MGLTAEEVARIRAKWSQQCLPTRTMLDAEIQRLREERERLLRERDEARAELAAAREELRKQEGITLTLANELARVRAELARAIWPDDRGWKMQELRRERDEARAERDAEKDKLSGAIFNCETLVVQRDEARAALAAARETVRAIWPDDE